MKNEYSLLFWAELSIFTNSFAHIKELGDAFYASDAASFEKRRFYDALVHLASYHWIESTVSGKIFFNFNNSDRREIEEGFEAEVVATVREAAKEMYVLYNSYLW